MAFSNIEQSQNSMLPASEALTMHPSFQLVAEKLKEWSNHPTFAFNTSIYTDLYLFFLLSNKKFLDHRTPNHLCRLILGIDLIKKKLLQDTTFALEQRFIEIRWFPTQLHFPFSSKSVLGCLIGYNVLDKYELFDEESILFALQKHLPGLRLVKESLYQHSCSNKHLKILYLEIDKENGQPFTQDERKLLKKRMGEKVKNSFQALSPSIFMGHNEEDTYKNILVLSQEIETLNDLPQAHISLEQQTGKEIIFLVTLVFIAPFHHFSLKKCFIDCLCTIQRTLTVRHLEEHSIEANIFRLHLPREANYLRSDGSLDFYAARQKVSDLIRSAIGEFRDYNGGIIIKQQEALTSFKECYPELSQQEPELLETFFYSLIPLEQQMVLPLKTQTTLFDLFLKNRQTKLSGNSTYSFKTHTEDERIFFLIRGNDNTMIEILNSVIGDFSFNTNDLTYNILDLEDGIFFNSVISKEEISYSFTQALKQSLNEWQQKKVNRQVLRIAFEYPTVALDPRIRGDENSGEILRLLFEGLTRFDQNGRVVNAAAQSIEISQNALEYTFNLKLTFWNDGSIVTAQDFEYAWKKILSPDFKTSFAFFFYPIKNAKEAKEGKVSLDTVGIKVVNDRTLKVELAHPAPDFLQLTAHPLYSPVNRLVDQQHPQWPYEYEKNYPCNGPFQLKLSQFNQGYQLVKNKFYWDSQSITLDEIYITVTQLSHMSQKLQKKEVDWIGNPFGGWHNFYQLEKDYKLLSIPNSWVFWSEFNTRSQLFSNLKIRQAFVHAIQREQILIDSFMPLTVARSILIPLANDKPRALFPNYNAEEAKRLFNEGLQELGLDSKDLPPIRIIFAEKGIREHTASNLRNQFREIFDVECQLLPLAPNKLLGMKAQKSNIQGYDLALMHWTARIDDPMYTLNYFKFAHPDANFTRWENPEYQKLLDQANQELNFFKRSSLLLQAEILLTKEFPVLPLFYQPNLAIVRKDFNVKYKLPSGPFDIARGYFEQKVKL